MKDSPQTAAGRTPEEKRRLLAELLRGQARAGEAVREGGAGPAPGAAAPGDDAEAATALHRRQFPALAEKAYFNYGAQGPLPRTALSAIVNSYEELQRWGPFSFETNVWLDEELARTRAALAKELGVEASCVALTESVSAACNVALWGVDWRPGEHLLLSDCENPGVVLAAREVGRRFGLRVSTCALGAARGDADVLEAVGRELRPETRLVVLSHVLWNTGRVLPLAGIVELCRSHSKTGRPAKVLADGAQSAGVLPLDLARLGVDLYAFTGQKWWCGPEGVGGLYVRAEVLEELRPTFVGWRALWGGLTGDAPPADARRFETGTSPYPLYAGLRAALALQHEWGTPRERYGRIKELSGYFWRRLSEVRDRAPAGSLTLLQDSPPEAGIVSFRVAAESQRELAEFLEARRTLVRTMHDPDCVRACLHYLTLRSEVDRLAEQIEEFCRRPAAASAQPGRRK